MIDTKELRIGNYIYGIWNDGEMDEDEYNIVKFSGYDPLDSWIHCENISKGQDEYYLFDPIPIAEDWLFNLGFIEEGFDEEGTWYDIYIGEDRLTINIEKGVLMIGNIYNWFIPPADYKYIHQIQNLYFALTGEELKLKGDE